METAKHIADHVVDTAPAIDLYREVHKGLRRALFELVDRAGSLDTTDLEAIKSFQALFGDLDMMLRTHHAHEDSPALAALISQHAADIGQTNDHNGVHRVRQHLV